MKQTGKTGGKRAEKYGENNNNRTTNLKNEKKGKNQERTRGKQ